MLKLSKVVPPKNTEAFRLQTIPVGERAYQSAVSADGKLFVTSARGPKDGSRLMRLNAGTLAVEAEATLPKDKKGEQIGVFGVGVDNAHNHVWTTNTLAETVTVYDAKTLSVVKVFPEGSVVHPRDVIIDEAHNRAYVSAALTGFIEVYDTKSLEHIGQLEFVVEHGKNMFNNTDLALDSAGGKLFGVSRDTPWVGWIDLKTGKSTTVKVPEAQGATDITRDPATGRLEVPDVALPQTATPLSEEDVKKVQNALSLAKTLEDKKLWRRAATVYTSMLGMTTTANELWLLAKMRNRCLRNATRC
ncbi:uncharacterized protein BN745_03499 [Klebsiella variicola CAG:634]|nr:uncharacterized protein BN745_03499 [Klebsiella variicola CAG:634]